MGTKTATEVLEKTPNEAKNYDFDFGPDMADSETIVASSPTLSVTPSSGLVKSQPSVSGQKVQYLLSAGTVNTDYSLVCKITTSSGETIEGRGILRVRPA